MPKTWLEIADIMSKRREARGPLIEQMMQVRERYNGDWVLPDLGGNSTPLIPTIIADAIDNNGLRAGSVRPDVVAPATGNTGTSRTRAAARRKGWLYTWEKSELDLHLYRAYRHFFGYATSVFSVEPDMDDECVRVKVLDPLHAFPEPKSADDLTPPRDCGFIYGKSGSWLRHHYPHLVDRIDLRGSYGREDVWDICEWVDDEWIVHGVLGPRSDLTLWGSDSTSKAVELRRWPNRAGRCTVVTASRLTLDRVHSQVAKIVGHSDLEARLMYLDILATQKSVAPDMFILGSSAAPPQLVGNRWKQGHEGEPNIILDAQVVDTMRLTPDPNNKITMDRLERNARVSTGQTPIMQGETYGGARTGRGIDALLGAAVDPRIQEAQRVMQARLTDVNKIVADAYVGYWPTRKYHVFSGWTADPEMIDFTPEQAFEVKRRPDGSVESLVRENKVEYPLPGTDIVGMNVVVHQTVGSEMMSRRTGRVLHPFIRDAEYEERQVLIEKVDAAIDMQVLARASDPNGGWTPVDLAVFSKAIQEGQSRADAILAADQNARERQAREAPPTPPGMGAAPETMPGLANPGEGAESLPGTIPEPDSDLANLDRMLGALSAPPVRAS